MARLDKFDSKSKKNRALDLLSVGLPKDRVADEVGVAKVTIRRWMNDAAFVEELHKRSTALLKENLPKLYNVMADLAAQGSHQHLKLLLEHLARIEEARNHVQGSVTFTWKDGNTQE